MSNIFSRRGRRITYVSGFNPSYGYRRKRRYIRIEPMTKWQWYELIADLLAIGSVAFFLYAFFRWLAL